MRASKAPDGRTDGATDGRMHPPSARDVRLRYRVSAALFAAAAIVGGIHVSTADGFCGALCSMIVGDHIRVGMTRAEVESILGPPLRERPGDNDGGVLMDYAIEGTTTSFSFWIYFDPPGHVDTVRVAESPMLAADHYAIYDAQRNRPVYEHPQFAKMIDAPAIAPMLRPMHSLSERKP